VKGDRFAGIFVIETTIDVFNTSFIETLLEGISYIGMEPVGTCRLPVVWLCSV
jgi:hypothetical protein